MNGGKDNFMDGEREVSFEDYAIVACGTLRLELNYLMKSGFLNIRKILYTKPGRHEDTKELESQLVRQIGNAKKYSNRIIVVYGGKYCYINAYEPSKSIDLIIQNQGQGIVRIGATHCMDMLIGAEDREKISHGGKVLWLTPGWVLYRDFVFQDG